MKKTENKVDTTKKRTDIQIEFDKIFIASLLVKCIPVREIAVQLNKRNEETGVGYELSYQQVHYDIKKIYDDWRSEKEDYIDAKMELELAKLDKIEVECWAAWEASKQGTRKTVIKGGEMIGQTMSGGKIDSREIETTFGDTKFLDIIQKCMDRRAALLGLNAPTKILAGVVSGISNMSKEDIEKELNETWQIPPTKS